MPIVCSSMPPPFILNTPAVGWVKAADHLISYGKGGRGPEVLLEGSAGSDAGRVFPSSPDSGTQPILYDSSISRLIKGCHHRLRDAARSSCLFQQFLQGQIARAP